MGLEQKQIMWFNNIFSEFVKRKKGENLNKPVAKALIRTCQNSKNVSQSLL